MQHDKNSFSLSHEHRCITCVDKKAHWFPAQVHTPMHYGSFLLTFFSSHLHRSHTLVTWQYKSVHDADRFQEEGGGVGGRLSVTTVEWETSPGWRWRAMGDGGRDEAFFLLCFFSLCELNAVVMRSWWRRWPTSSLDKDAAIQNSTTTAFRERNKTWINK